jgi:hypothetical protein
MAGEKELLVELTEIKSSIEKMSESFNERMKALEDRIAGSLELSNLGTAKRFEAVEKDVIGLSARIDEKIGGHEEAIHALQGCEADCTEKRHGIHERIDKLRDETVMPLKEKVDRMNVYLIILWVAIGAVLAALVAAGADKLIGG